MAQTPLDLTLSQAVRALRTGVISSSELTRAYLERIELLDSSLNTFITLSPDKALADAERADKFLNKWRADPTSDIPPCLGVPVAIKDALCVKDIRCTCGSKILENFIPPYNATSVDRLLSAGVVILGKTNTDEFAMGSSTENSAYGVTRNPWNPERVPGGSSGGSAAAVSAKLAPAALGTDTGGSVRLPASYCGVTGLKPTYGRVSRFGLVAFGSSLDVVGILGRDVVDTTAVFSVISGHDPLDATSAAYPPVEISLESTAMNSDALLENIKKLRIGVPDEYFVTGMQPEVDRTVVAAIELLGSMGAEIVPVSLPHTEYAVPVYYLIAPAEASANLARYDGIRYGPRVQADSMRDIFRRTRGEKFGPEVKRRIMLGTYILSAGYYEAYYSQAQKVRTLIKNDFDAAFDKVDVIAAPVAPTTAFPIGAHRDDPLSMYLEDVFTLPANLAGIPALTFPVGFDQQELPIGMQLMAPQFREDVILKVAYAYQLQTNWHKREPPL